MQKLAKYSKYEKGFLTVKRSLEERNLELLEFQRDILRAITRKTNSQIQSLEVLLESDRVIISGYCKTYYMKQLAQEAVLKIARKHEIINDILVYR